MFLQTVVQSNISLSRFVRPSSVVHHSNNALSDFLASQALGGHESRRCWWTASWGQTLAVHGGPPHSSSNQLGNPGAHLPVFSWQCGVKWFVVSTTPSKGSVILSPKSPRSVRLKWLCKWWHFVSNWIFPMWPRIKVREEIHLRDNDGSELLVWRTWGQAAQMDHYIEEGTTSTDSSGAGAYNRPSLCHPPILGKCYATTTILECTKFIKIHSVHSENCWYGDYEREKRGENGCSLLRLRSRYGEYEELLRVRGWECAALGIRSSHRFDIPHSFQAETWESDVLFHARDQSSVSSNNQTECMLPAFVILNIW